MMRYVIFGVFSIFTLLIFYVISKFIVLRVKRTINRNKQLAAINRKVIKLEQLRSSAIANNQLTNYPQVYKYIGHPIALLDISEEDLKNIQFRKIDKTEFDYLLKELQDAPEQILQVMLEYADLSRSILQIKRPYMCKLLDCKKGISLCIAKLLIKFLEFFLEILLKMIKNRENKQKLNNFESDGCIFEQTEIIHKKLRQV